MSPLLARLAVALPKLRPAKRRSAERLLARPTDGAADPGGSGWTASEAAKSPLCSQHYCVHWVASGRDAPPGADSNSDGVPDWVDTVDATAEHVHAVENGQLGWQPPKSDGSRGGGHGLTDIYLADLGDSGLYGYSATDPDQPLTHSMYAYLVLDNDFAPSQFPGYASPVDPLDVTVAHEYNHILQYGYDVLEQVWMFEATAVWAEGRVYPAVHDYLQYLPQWVRLTTQPITTFDGTNPDAERNLKVYGSSVWSKWLDSRFGPSVIRGAFEDSAHTRPQSFAPAAYGASIRQHGGHGFADEFDHFAAATAEWQASNSGFPEGFLYPDVRRIAALRVNGNPLTLRLDHTAYGLLNLGGHPSRRVRLAVKTPRGTRAAVALVGRTGGAPGGRMTVRLHELPHGGRGTVVIGDPTRFRRLTAAVVNSDTSTRGFSQLRDDWTFRKNRQRFYVDVSTDFTRPHVRARHPRSGARVARHARIRVTFSERVLGVSRATFELFDRRGHHVRARVRFAAGGRRATLIPRRALHRGSTYRVRLTGAITDLALNPLRRTTWRFRVR